MQVDVAKFCYFSFKDLYKRTPENHPDRNKLNKALSTMVTSVFV